MTSLYQLWIDGQKTGTPMIVTEVIKWRKVLMSQFPNSLIVWEKAK